MRSEPFLATAGPAAAGAILAMRLGDATTIVVVPAIVVGVAAVTVPALYIATAAIGAAPPLERVAGAALRGLAALGVVLLGLAAPVGFLAATAIEPTTGVALVWAALGFATLFGVAAFHRALVEDTVPSPLRGILFTTWAGVALVIGASLLAGAS